MTDVVVLIDRQQGGAKRMAGNGLTLHSAFTLTFILDTLVSAGLVDDATSARVKQFVADNQTDKTSQAALSAASAPSSAPAVKRCVSLGAFLCPTM